MSWLSPSCPLHLVEGPRALGWHGLEFLLQQMGQELRKAVDFLATQAASHAIILSGPYVNREQAL